MSHAKILPVRSRLCAHPCELCAHPCDAHTATRARRGGAMTGPPALPCPRPARCATWSSPIPACTESLSSTTLRARTAVKCLGVWAGQACCASAPLSALSWCTHPDAPPHMRASAARRPTRMGRAVLFSIQATYSVPSSLGPAPCPGSGAGQPHHARRLPRQATWLSAPGGQRQPG